MDQNNQNIKQHKHSTLAFAASLGVGVIYTICTIGIAIFPKQSLQIFYSVMHTKTLPIKVEVTFTSYFIGLITFFIFSFVLTWLIDCFYCILSSKLNRYR